MSVAKIFDQSFYLSNNADVAVAISQGFFADAAQHFNLFGAKELRDPNASFDASYYAAQNPDVLAAVSSGLIASVFAHYQSHGEAENRAPTAAFEGFDAAGYLAANADVKAAVEAGSFTSALDHYIAFGKEEGRGGADVTTPTKPGESFKLTTDIDTLVGTSGDDVFTGSAQSSDSTANLGDTIDGGAGNDTLKIAANAGVNLPDLTNVETLEITDTVHDDLDVSNMSGLTNLILKNGKSAVGTGNSALEFDSGLSLSLINIDDAAAATGADAGGGFDITAADAVTEFSLSVEKLGGSGNSGNDDIDLNFDSASKLATLNIASNGSSTSYISVDGVDDTLKTLNISGAAALTVTGSDKIKTIDASAATGKISFAVSDLDATITGGSADDIFTFAAGSLDKKDTVDGGEGTDTVAVALDGSVSKTLGFSNVEALRVNATSAATIDVSGSGVSTIEIAEDGAATDLTIKDAASDIALFYRGDGGTAAQTFDNVTVDFASTSGDTTLSVTANNQDKSLSKSGDDVNVNFGILGISGIEDVKFDYQITGADAKLQFSSAGALEDLEITAANSESFTLATVGSEDDSLESIDLSGVAGDITITEAALNGATGDITVTTADGDDTITVNVGGAGGEIILNTGAGMDTVILGQNYGVVSKDTDANDEFIKWETAGAGDRLNVDALVGNTATSDALEAAAESSAGLVTKEGEWHYDSSSGVLTIFNNVGAGTAATGKAVAVNLDDGLTLTVASIGSADYFMLG